MQDCTQVEGKVDGGGQHCFGGAGLMGENEPEGAHPSGESFKSVDGKAPGLRPCRIISPRQERSAEMEGAAVWKPSAQGASDLHTFLHSDNIIAVFSL